jgi:hypothetical protein
VSTGGGGIPDHPLSRMMTAAAAIDLPDGQCDRSAVQSVVEKDFASRFAKAG